MSRSHFPQPLPAFGLGLAVLSPLLPGPTRAQSDGASRQSEISLAASVEVPVAVATALSQGGRLMVEGVKASGEMVVVTVSAVGSGASFVVHLSAAAARKIGLVAGTAIVVTAVAAGWLLSVAGETLCFIANEGARHHVHSHRLDL